MSKVRYYQFSERGFNNEYQLVKCTSNEVFNKLYDKFYAQYGINARVWNIKRKNITKKEMDYCITDTCTLTEELLHECREKEFSF